MKNKISKMLVAIGMILSVIGCGTPIENNEQSSSIDDSSTVEPEIVPTIESDNENDVSEEEITIDESITVEENKEQTLSEEEIKKAEEEAKLQAEEEKKKIEQQNSFSMMYYLAITAEEIRTSKDNRLELENIYTSLLNDINPGAVDEITQDHLKNLRDIIKSYLNISTKRERLQYIYNQEKATAMRNAIPNPLAILSITNAMDWKKLALTVAYTAVDSYNSYKKASESAEMSFIMSGWELDDEEKDTVMKNRDRAFDYMVDMVQEYKLDGLKTLNEKAIENFAEISAITNDSERIRRLLSEESTYSLLGNYWLELANAYFATEQYEKCLECVEKYNDLSMGIYRKDFNYAQILPKAIVAAQKVYSDNQEQYVDMISNFADAIISNTSTDDWSVRYFTAQVYLDLYKKTNDSTYLEKAYNIALENVVVLLKEQRSLNETYLADVVEQSIEEPDYSYMTDSEKKEAKKEYKEEKKRVKAYNKALKEARKTELPTLYEPLVLNCELLFALADKLDISDEDKKEINEILETKRNGIFLVNPINDAYSFGGNTTANTIELSKDDIVIPANLLTAESSISISIVDNNTETVIDDYKISKVERNGSTIDNFKAYISSKKWKKYSWTENSKITITIDYADAYEKSVSFKFAVGSYKKQWLGDKVEFTAQ